MLTMTDCTEKPVVEKPPVVHHHRGGGDDRERDVTEDESSLYYIIRNSKSAIAVQFLPQLSSSFGSIQINRSFYLSFRMFQILEHC